MNAMDLAFQRKYTRNLTFDVTYTLSKNLSDDNGAGGNRGDGEGDSPSNPYNVHGDYGNVFYIPRHRVVADTVWDLPVGRGHRFGTNMPKVADYVVGGWETAVIFVAQTGHFLTPTYDGATASGGATQNIRPDLGIGLRPDCIGNWTVANPGRTQWYNPAAFARPALGSYGNCGVGIFQGPGLWSTNIGIHKAIPVGTKVSVRFEANMMNAFNHQNLGDPATNINSVGTPQITSTNGGVNALNPSVTSVSGERHIWGGVRVQF